MAQDLAAYRAIPRPPIRSRYRQYDLAGFPPPSSGGVHVAQILNILQHFSSGKGMTADWAHLVVEAIKLAFADRAYWLGDADFTVPNGLVDVSYARALAGRIDPGVPWTCPHTDNFPFVPLAVTQRIFRRLMKKDGG